jgi:hypothetical protein
MRRVGCRMLLCPGKGNQWAIPVGMQRALAAGGMGERDDEIGRRNRWPETR